MRWEWFARMQLAGGMDHGSAGMINNDELRLIQIKNFTQFFGYPKLIKALFYRKNVIVSQSQEFLGISVDIAPAGDWQTQRGSPENVRNKSKMLAVPGIKIWTGAGRHREFDHGNGLALHRDINSGGRQIEPAGLESIDLIMPAQADFKGKLLKRAQRAPAASGQLDSHPKPAGVGSISNEAQ